MKSFFVVVGILFPLIAGAQFNIKGTVFEDSTGVPIAGANLYLSDLNIGAVSAVNGDFEIKNAPKGKFLLSVSTIGYATKIIKVEFPSELNLNIYLEPRTVVVPEVVVFGHSSSSSKESPNTIQPISSRTMQENGAMNLSDGIAKIPGISQLTTGAGISKPVIRGLYGNRIQTVMLGLRFDNQQWQDEHGMGLNDFGIDRVEVIKGAASLLYGSEAMGGVIHIIEEKPSPVGRTTGDVNSKFFSNTNGYSLDAGIKKSTEKLSWRIRLGTESHADYKDGNATRILNSRYGGYFAKASLGIKRKSWVSQNHYFFSWSNYGFLMDTIQLYDTPDPRNSRSFDRPHHTVFLNVFSSNNYITLPHSTLRINAGFQVNNRQEQEGGNKISLDMMMNTSTLNAIWTKNIGRSELSVGTQDFFQTNRNFGSRMIIPNANLFESSIYGYWKTLYEYVSLEGGIRYDARFIESLPTLGLNVANGGPGNDIHPFSRWLSSLNGALGLSLFDEKHWNVKANLTTGYRSANLAEFSSNGLHEGTVRYEIGNINLNIEQNLCADIFASYQNKHVTISGSGFYNRFLNYIYLAPTNTEYLGFQIFNYVQNDAFLYGTEANFILHPHKWKGFQFENNYSIVRGEIANGEYLPFIPAGKFGSAISYKSENKEKKRSWFIRGGGNYVLEQNHPGAFETSTGDYFLINAGGGFSFEKGNKEYRISIVGNNLSNQVYYDHLSRFKYFGIYNIGRNININFKISFK